MNLHTGGHNYDKMVSFLILARIQVWQIEFQYDSIHLDTCQMLIKITHMRILSIDILKWFRCAWQFKKKHVMLLRHDSPSK